MSLTDSSADSSVGSAQDSILGAAQAFEQQLEQMSTWKHQLAHQMEVMRRDGIKLLERQKTLAVERKRIADEREQLLAEKQHIQMLQEELAGEAKQFKQKNAELDRARAEMKKLEGERQHWANELAEARTATAELTEQRSTIQAQLADAEARMQALATQVTEGEALLARAATAKDALAEIEALREAQETAKHDLDLRAAELAAKERALAEQEARQLSADVQYRSSMEQLEIEHRNLADLQRTLVADREAFTTQRQEEIAAFEGRTATLAAQEERNATIHRELTARQEELEAAHATLQAQLSSLATDRETLVTAQATHTAAVEQSNNELTEKETAILTKLAEREMEMKARVAEAEASHVAAVEAANAAFAEKEAALSARAVADEAAVTMRLVDVETSRAALVEKEAALAAKKAADEAQLQSRLVAADEQVRKADEQVRKADEQIKKVEEERKSLTTHRRELEAKLGTLEAELTTQLEALAGQNKRLSERRADIESRSVELEQEVAARTTEMRKEMEETRAGYEARIVELEEASKLAESKMAEIATERAALQQQIQQATDKYDTTDGELAHLRALVAEAQQQSASHAAQVEAEREAQERIIAEWREKLDTAIAEAAEHARLAEEAKATSITEARAQAELQALAELEAAQQKLEATFEQRLESERQSALAKAQAELESQLATQLEARLADRPVEQNTVTVVDTAEIESLRAKLAEVEAEKAAIEARVVDAAPDTTRLDALAKQAKMLEAQRDNLATELFNTQDTLRRQTEDAMLSRNGIEAELIDLRQKFSSLEGHRRAIASQAMMIEQQKAALDQQRMAFEADKAKNAATVGYAAPVEESGTIKFRKERMLRQAKALRHHRKHTQQTLKSVSQTQLDVAQQQEQLRIRKENLEQVKRLLEKQELVMARKLADHSSLKTVATVGMFILVVLGIVFSGVYKFITPVYRSEAVVQLAPPKDLAGARLDSWYADQADFVKSEDATFSAWRTLRTPEEHYAMQDTREEWINTLNDHLTVKTDPTSHTLLIQYNGPSGEGVSQVCNALATAYATPSNREGTAQAQMIGAGAILLAKAMPPMYPTGDRRLIVALSSSAIVLVLSGLVALVVRRYVMRQMREIEQMSDEQDLEDVRQAAVEAAA